MLSHSIDGPRRLRLCTAFVPISLQRFPKPCLSRQIPDLNVLAGDLFPHIRELQRNFCSGAGRKHELCRASPQGHVAIAGVEDPGKEIISKINGATKWGVALASSITLALQRNENATWCILGSIFALYICKVLKFVINQARPDGAAKLDPGMPSTHAVTLSFLSTYVALSLLGGCSKTLARHAAAGALVTAAVLLAWLRVVLGFHTPEQVLVGGLLGTTSAATWHRIGVTWALPAFARNSMAKIGLHVVTGTTILLFLVKTVAKWRKSHVRAPAGNQG